MSSPAPDPGLLSNLGERELGTKAGDPRFMECISEWLKTPKAQRLYPNKLLSPGWLAMSSCVALLYTCGIGSPADGDVFHKGESLCREIDDFLHESYPRTDEWSGDTSAKYASTVGTQIDQILRLRKAEHEMKNAMDNRAVRIKKLRRDLGFCAVCALGSLILGNMLLACGVAAARVFAYQVIWAALIMVAAGFIYENANSWRLETRLIKNYEKLISNLENLSSQLLIATTTEIVGNRCDTASHSGQPFTLSRGSAERNAEFSASSEQYLRGEKPGNRTLSPIPLTPAAGTPQAVSGHHSPYAWTNQTTRPAPRPGPATAWEAASEHEEVDDTDTALSEPTWGVPAQVTTTHGRHNSSPHYL